MLFGFIFSPIHCTCYSIIILFHVLYRYAFHNDIDNLHNDINNVCYIGMHYIMILKMFVI
jgi:hypothetical protein